jgi:hypothetical protein
VIPVRQGRASASLHIEQDINQAFETFNEGLSSLPEVLHVTLKAMCRSAEVVPALVDLEVAVPHLSPAVW